MSAGTFPEVPTGLDFLWIPEPLLPIFKKTRQESAGEHPGEHPPPTPGCSPASRG